MGTEEEGVREKLLSSEENSASESHGLKNMKVSSTIIENEKVRMPVGDSVEGDLRLHDAVYDPDNIAEIEKLVADEPQLVNEKDQEGRTPLHALALAGDVKATEIAKIILGIHESRKDLSIASIDRPEVLNLQDSYNSTVLHYAAQGRQTELVHALLKWGASPVIVDRYGNSPLHLAAEGNTEKAIEVATLLLDQKPDLLNVMNNKEHTPLHVAVEKKAVDMVNFLLGRQPDLSVKNSLRQTALHFATTATGESESSCEIVKSILGCCKQDQLNQTDSRGRTALHLAALKRYPKIIKVLMADKRLDVVKCDDKERTALHYAAEDGCYTKGYQCVEALIDWKFEKYAAQVDYLYKREDSFKRSAFMYACVNCPAETMKKYMALCPQPQNWLSSLYMTLLYKNSPMALKPLMDKAFSEEAPDPPREGEDGINTDFGIITGYIDPVDTMPQQESKYLRQSLWWDYDAQKEILLHPVSQLFITKKWQKLKWIISFWILWQLIWLVAYTSLGLTFYAGNEKDASSGESETSSAIKDAVPLISAIIMLLYLVGSVINEFFEMYTIGSAYILSLTNILQLVQCGLGFIAIYPVCTGYEEPDNWMKYTTATGILLAYVLSMRDIGKLHSEIGLIVEVLKQVLIQIMQVLVCCSPLWIGFTVAFIIIFDNEESLKSGFPGPIVKVLVMMTGEFEYNDTFKDEEGAKTPANAYIRTARLIFFLAFLISVPVGFFNLLTGFALDKVMELRERAKVARVAKQLEHIYFIESILLSFRPLRKIFSHAVIVSFLRRLNVTSKWFNTDKGPELKFETLITENIRKTERNFTRSLGFKNKLCHNTKFCQSSGLSDEVRKEIYGLASPSPS